MPKGLHPETLSLVKRFAVALAKKLRLAEEKYGYSDGWRNDDWLDECREKLRHHIGKSDPLDVAAYCAFLWHHKDTTWSPADESDWNFDMDAAPRDGTEIDLWLHTTGGTKMPSA